MTLSAAAIALAQTRLATLLDPVKSEGARLTLSPILRGPLSKGEVQMFYAGSTSTPPTVPRFNSAWEQVRTINWVVNITLKDLNQPEPALPLLETTKGLLTGAQLFGAFPTLPYEGGLYVVRDSFRRVAEKDQAIWYYQIDLACQIDEALPVPTVPTIPD